MNAGRGLISGSLGPPCVVLLLALTAGGGTAPASLSARHPRERSPRRAC